MICHKVAYTGAPAQVLLLVSLGTIASAGSELLLCKLMLNDPQTTLALVINVCNRYIRVRAAANAASIPA